MDSTQSYSLRRQNMRTTIASVLLALALLASLAAATVPVGTVIAATPIYVNATAGDDA